MKNFYSPTDVDHLESLLDLMSTVRRNPTGHAGLGKGKTLAMLFFNPSLRTKMSTHRAAINLGLDVITMDMKNAWGWATEEGTVMDGPEAEHIREATHVIDAYADLIAIRSFAALKSKSEDDRDSLMQKFMSASSKPVINLESTLRHPLQSLTDLYTIRSTQKTNKPKIVLSWAPHPKPLPHTVALSFLEWMHRAGYGVTVTHPPGYELDPAFMKGHHIEYDQRKAAEGADFIYVKNWSASEPYGQVLTRDPSRTVDLDLLRKTNNARLMHCLPVRRNMVMADDAIDSSHSIIPMQAENRLYAAQAVLIRILQKMQES